MERLEDIPRLEDCPTRGGWVIIDESGVAYSEPVAEIMIVARLEAVAAATVDSEAYEECRLMLWSWGRGIDDCARLPLLYPDLMEHRDFADEARCSGVPASDILAVADVLGELADAYAAGVPMEDLFA